MIERIYLDTIKDHSREEVLAESYFFLNDWSIKTVDFGKHANDRDVLMHALRNFDKYYHINKFPDYVFKDRGLMFEYLMNIQYFVTQGMVDEAVPKLKEFQDNPDFFKLILDKYIVDLNEHIEYEYFTGYEHIIHGDGGSFPISLFDDFGFTGHIPHARLFLDEYSKIIGNSIIEDGMFRFIDRSSNLVEWVAIRNYIDSRNAIKEANELDAFLSKSTTSSSSKKGRL